MRDTVNNPRITGFGAKISVGMKELKNPSGGPHEFGSKNHRNIP